MAKLSRDDVLKLAQLAKLKLSEEDVERFRSELSEILGYVEQLGNVDVAELEPTNQVTGLSNIMREDEVREYEPISELLKNAPATEANLIKVKRVIE